MQILTIQPPYKFIINYYLDILFILLEYYKTIKSGYQNFKVKWKNGFGLYIHFSLRGEICMTLSNKNSI